MAKRGPDYVLALAREMRRKPTPEEAKLWGELRARKLAGLKFRNQHLFGRYIVDFYCAERMIAIEVDGLIHEQQKEYDYIKDRVLGAQGVIVLRFTNDEINDDLEDVLEHIKSVCGK